MASLTLFSFRLEPTNAIKPNVNSMNNRNMKQDFFEQDGIGNKTFIVLFFFLKKKSWFVFSFFFKTRHQRCLHEIEYCVDSMPSMIHYNDHRIGN
jgi:endonuclease III-like uncharacterized protein